MKVKTANGVVADVVVGIPCYVTGCMSCMIAHQFAHIVIGDRYLGSWMHAPARNLWLRGTGPW